MTTEHETITVEMIPVDQIAVINPRTRDTKAFRQIVDSISKVGLKKPITVSRNGKGNSETPYRLVCGQGRLEAFISLGEREIPANVIDVTEEVEADADFILTAGHLEAWESEHGAIPPGSWVLMHSGWAKRFDDAGATTGRNPRTDAHPGGPGRPADPRRDVRHLPLLRIDAAAHG